MRSLIVLISLATPPAGCPPCCGLLETSRTRVLAGTFFRRRGRQKPPYRK